jgi:thiamine pyrophosphokinase
LRDFLLNKKQRAIIFANGNYISNDYLLESIKDGDILIAADGGMQHLRRLGVLPHVLIGDLDSIQSAHLSELEKKDVLILSYPSRKDETDLELALQYAKQLGIIEVIILFALGARWDMTIANLLLPGAEEFKDMNIRIIDGQHEIALLRSGMTLQISGRAGDTVSLIPLGSKAEGITSFGLEYQLMEDSLDLGSPRGVSNVLIDDEASIHLRSGLLLCIHMRKIEAE